jgi:phage baseplate assembly protein W
MARYSDIDLFLPKNNLTNDISFKTDVYAIAQSISNLALTRRGERPFYPNLGTDLVDTLQVNRSQLELNVLKEVLKSQLETQETRAIIDNIQIIRESDNYSVKIDFHLSNSTEIAGTVSVTV